MDVDLLRPGTVPISPDTILWFEFLLDPNRLKNHLSRPNPEPTACELIEEFLSVDNKSGNSKPTSERVVDVDAPPTPPTSATPAPALYTRKQLALKILALRVTASLHWNLDIFETKLAPQSQQQLMHDLVYMATDAAFAVPPQEMPAELLALPQVQFALTLYHRWIVRFPVKTALYAKSSKMSFMHLPGVQGETNFSPLNPNFEKVLRMCEASRMHSIKFLEDMLSLYDPKCKDPKRIKIPVMESFIHLTEVSNDMHHDWNAGDNVTSQYELAMQIHFDLCYNYFFYGQHDLAKKQILGCRENSNLLEEDVSIHGYGPQKQVPWGNFYYASMTNDDIVGYIRALNLGYELLNEEPSLLQKLQESIANHYTGIIAVLQADNLTREIPMIHRQVAELDIQGSSSSGAFTVARDLLNRVSALNAVRYALEGGIPSTHPDFLNKFKTVGLKFFDLLFWALGPVLTSNLSDADWANLKMFFLHLATSQCRLPIDRIEGYLRKHIGDQAEAVRRKLISNEQLNTIMNDPINLDDESMEMPPELLSDDWDMPDFELNTVPELEMGRLQKRLIESSTADDVRMCLVKLAMMKAPLPLWKLSPSWKPAGALGNAIVSLPRGFMQDFGYVVSGAARARAEAGCSRAALSLLSVLEGEARSLLDGGNDPNLYRLCRLLSWEVLFLQVNVVLSEWPHHRLNLKSLANKCKSCIAAMTSNDGIVPRPQVIEACWSCLVNACEWEGAGAGAGPGELAAALCAACFDLQRGKGNRKFARPLWDYALVVYTNPPSGAVKRNASGAPHGRDAQACEARNGFNAFLATLREPVAVSVVLSLLARLHNLLIDDASLELVVEYTSLWPATISNSNNYSAKHVLESLTDLLERSLKLYPYNTSWLRLYGDVESVCSRWGGALRRYLCALAAGSGHFSKRAPDEAGLARRAARACLARAAPSQAAALCQLPDEPDYTTAFKCIAEKVSFTERAPDEAGLARRAARACLARAAPSQAAALCQLPDEPDYTTAFKCIAEKVSFTERAPDEAGLARRAARACLARAAPSQAAALCQLPDEPDYTTAFKCIAEKVSFTERAPDEAGLARRAARACLARAAPSQAAALCQLPDEPDYTTAFKCIAEKVSFTERAPDEAGLARRAARACLARAAPSQAAALCQLPDEPDYTTAFKCIAEKVSFTERAPDEAGLARRAARACLARAAPSQAAALCQLPDEPDYTTAFKCIAEKVSFTERAPDEAGLARRAARACLARAAPSQAAALCQLPDEPDYTTAFKCIAEKVSFTERAPDEAGLARRAARACLARAAPSQAAALCQLPDEPDYTTAFKCIAEKVSFTERAPDEAGLARRAARACLARAAPSQAAALCQLPDEPDYTTAFKCIAEKVSFTERAPDEAGLARRAARACLARAAPSQAAALCQLPDEPDYTTAFKCIAEKVSFTERAPDEAGLARRAARACLARAAPSQAAPLCQLPDEPDYTTAFKCIAEKVSFTERAPDEAGLARRAARACLARAAPSQAAALCQLPDEPDYTTAFKCIAEKVSFTERAPDEAGLARRAARACLARAAPSQAAALCQLPDEPDYTTAFKCIAEKVSFTERAPDEAGLARRAARACLARAAPSQAAALCQLPDEPDYTTAFKCIAEKVSFTERAPDEAGLARRAARACLARAAPSQAAALCQLPDEPDYTTAFKCIAEKVSFTERAPDEAGLARRAARACLARAAPSQAAALCQLPDEPDYTTAFKCIAEKTGNAADAMDGYYGCLWDGTLLEVAVALHARRGEGGRRARAVRAAGALELNANNSEDIQREAAATRRARLLRALTNQYVA